MPAAAWWAPSAPVQRAEARNAAAEKIWAEIEDGKHYTGVVKSLTSYGAFVDIGGVDGMVHISELSWSRIKHPSEVVSVGDDRGCLCDLRRPGEEEDLPGHEGPQPGPLGPCSLDKYPGGRRSQCPTIVKLMTFGAFAEIVPGVDGLIHISQIADHRIEKPGDVLAEGEMVDVKITDIDHGEHRRSPCPVVLLCAKQLLTMRKITTKNNLSSLSQTVT